MLKGKKFDAFTLLQWGNLHTLSSMVINLSTSVCPVVCFGQRLMWVHHLHQMMVIILLGARQNQSLIMIGVFTCLVVHAQSTTTQMVRPLLMLGTMLLPSIGVPLAACQILQSLKNFIISAIGLGSQVTKVQVVTLSQALTVTQFSSLLRATATSMVSTTMVRTVAIGLVRSPRMTLAAPVASTSAVTTSTRCATTTVAAGSLSAQSQKNKVG